MPSTRNLHPARGTLRTAGLEPAQKSSGHTGVAEQLCDCKGNNTCMSQMMQRSGRGVVAGMQGCERANERSKPRCVRKILCGTDPARKRRPCAPYVILYEAGAVTEGTQRRRFRKIQPLPWTELCTVIRLFPPPAPVGSSASMMRDVRVCISWLCTFRCGSGAGKGVVCGRAGLRSVRRRADCSKLKTASGEALAALEGLSRSSLSPTH